MPEVPKLKYCIDLLYNGDEKAEQYAKNIIIIA